MTHWFLSNNFDITKVRTIKTISLHKHAGTNKSNCLWKYDLINVCLFFHVGHPPATGTGTLYITLGDVNDNVPSLYPTLAKVCDDGKDLRIVVLGATDKDLPPNTDPFTFELSKQTGPEKMWRLATLNGKSITSFNYAFCTPTPTSQILTLRLLILWI